MDVRGRTREVRRRTRAVCYARCEMRPTPLIGVTTSITVGATPERAYVNSAYIRAVQDAGGVPVLLPPQLEREARAVLWPLLDGVVLTGGGDIDPARFGEVAHPAVYEV